MRKKSGYQAAMAGLYEHFAARGWALTARSPKSLWLALEPDTGVRHEMFVGEGVSREKLPPGFFAGVCYVLIHFPELEDMIKPCLGFAPEDRMSAVMRAIEHYAPQQDLYCGNTYLVETDPANGTAARQRFLDDIDHYLEPVRQRFNHVAVLADQDFVPRFIDPLGWSIWRAAYVKSTAESHDWHAYADRLEAQARQVLDGAGENAAGDSRIFTGIAALQRGASLRDAQELLTVLRGLR